MSDLSNITPSLNPAGPDDPVKYRAELRKAAEEFEGVFMAQLYRLMNQTVHKSDLFGDIPGQDIYKDMFITEVARTGSIAQEIGVAELLYRSLGGDTLDSMVDQALEPEPGPERPEISEVKDVTTKRIGLVRHP